MGTISSSDAHHAHPAPSMSGPGLVPLAGSGASAHVRWTADAVLEARQDWVVRAQDGFAEDVLAEVEQALRSVPEPHAHAAALYVQGLCLMTLGETSIAVTVARELIALCRRTGQVAGAVQARALLVELLRREGQLEQAVEQLAHGAAAASALDDLLDPEVQTALAALMLAHRMIGVREGAREIRQRLDTVERFLPRHQQVSRLSNLAFEHAERGVRAAHRPPFAPGRDDLAEAVATISRAAVADGGRTYRVVELERQVLVALYEAMLGDPALAQAQLTAIPGILERGPEAASAQVFWAIGMVRALARQDRAVEGAAIGARALAVVRGHVVDSERQVLAYEVALAEHPPLNDPGSGTIEYLTLAGRRADETSTLLDALFRARVDLLRGADERKVLARAARLDSLTNLVNRRGGADAISEAASLPVGEPVALLLIDLDGFKEVNDSQGHLAGDVVLREVSTALRTAARLEDVVARWGGDEFVVIAALEEGRAVALAERLQETIRHCPQSAGARISASIGVAVRTAPIDEHEWLRRADEAMYAAKRAGGNAAVVG
ncbi:GGDEF domain-containing protein [Kineosporia sp. NBRC 101731]|uniref:GGDEF domain-containing protein n=1 Tax=Kineosporia sp. NBRC 101731 TaxID=3032199 RepID=UPI0024A4D922|nr:GGDEF domain-containing protein [Kineosporia sp. NBRC 101731]GLY33312.1 diguanylate cyclase [Kineosporia sp. NBRC 101731]